VLGRKITYHKLTPDELAKKHMGFGLPPDYARSLAGLDTMIRGGGEDRINDVVQQVTGRPPRSFREFFEEN